MDDAVPPDPIQPGLFDVGPDRRLTLRGGRSTSTGLRHFPLRPVCPFTGADDVEAVDLPRDGRLRWWTVVHAAPPGYVGPVPYGLGVVALEGEPELRVVGRLDPGRSWAAGDAVTTVAEVIDTPDGARTTWAFAAVDR